MAGIDGDTKLMLHLDGADEAQSTTDSSPSNHTIGFTLDAKLDSAQKKFGATSLYVDGTGDDLEIADSADWDVFGSNADNWTVDFWYKFEGAPSGFETFLSQYESSNDNWRIMHESGAHGMTVKVLTGGGIVIQLGDDSTYIEDDTDWHHFALIKVADEYGYYIDGVQKDYTQDSSTDTYSDTLTIGSTESASSFFQGWMDEVRIQKSNYFNAAPNSTPNDSFTAPTAAYSWEAPTGAMNIGSEPAMY